MAAFVRVVERGSFAAAAADLGVTPSALSKLVTRIEERLGVRLLTRSTRKLTLTAEGDLFAQRSRDILASIDSAEAEVTASRTMPRGHLHLSVGTAFAKRKLAPVLPQFVARYPEITLQVDLSDRQVDLVAEQVDVAIRSGALADSSLVARKILEAKRVICASPAYLKKYGTPKTPADLRKHTCLVITGFASLAQWPFRTNEGINRLTIAGPFMTDNADLLLDMAIAGLGIARLADFMMNDAIRDGSLVPLLTDAHLDEPFPIHALTVAGRHRAPRVKAFIDFLVEHFGDQPKAPDTKGKS